MLEILAVIGISRKIAQVAQEKGRNSAWGILGAVGWFAGEVFGFLIGVMMTESIFGAYGFAIVGAIGGAVVAWLIVNNLPLAPHFQPAAVDTMLVTPNYASAAAPGIGAVPAMASPPRPKKRAGHCMECGTNVWLTETGSCPAGHGPQSITSVYSVDG